MMNNDITERELARQRIERRRSEHLRAMMVGARPHTSTSVEYPYQESRQYAQPQQQDESQLAIAPRAIPYQGPYLHQGAWQDAVPPQQQWESQAIPPVAYPPQGQSMVYGYFPLYSSAARPQQPQQLFSFPFTSPSSQNQGVENNLLFVPPGHLPQEQRQAQEQLQNALIRFHQGEQASVMFDMYVSAFMMREFVDGMERALSGNTAGTQPARRETGTEPARRETGTGTARIEDVPGNRPAAPEQPAAQPSVTPGQPQPRSSKMGI